MFSDAWNWENRWWERIPNWRERVPNWQEQILWSEKWNSNENFAVENIWDWNNCGILWNLTRFPNQTPIYYNATKVFLDKCICIHSKISFIVSNPLRTFECKSLSFPKRSPPLAPTSISCNGWLDSTTHAQLQMAGRQDNSSKHLCRSVSLVQNSLCIQLQCLSYQICCVYLCQSQCLFSNCHTQPSSTLWPAIPRWTEWDKTKKSQALTPPTWQLSLGWSICLSHSGKASIYIWSQTSGSLCWPC